MKNYGEPLYLRMRNDSELSRTRMKKNDRESKEIAIRNNQTARLIGGGGRQKKTLLVWRESSIT